MKNIIKTLTAVLLIIFTALSMFACADNKEDENSETVTKYTITLNSDGGTVEFSEIELSHGDAYLLPIPTKDGYTFDSWLLNGEVFANSGFYNYYEDITLLAKYNQNENGNESEKTYTITYDLAHNFATISSVTQTVEYNKAYQLLTPTLLGHTFVRWELDGVEFQMTGTYTLQKDITLKAVYKINGNSWAGEPEIN